MLSCSGTSLSCPSGWLSSIGMPTMSSTWATTQSMLSRSTNSTSWCSALRLYQETLLEHRISLWTGCARYTDVEHEHCGGGYDGAEQSWTGILTSHKVKQNIYKLIRTLKPGRNGGQASWCQRSAVKMTTRRSSTCAASQEIMNLGSFSTGSGAVIVLSVTPIWLTTSWKTNIGVAIGAMALMRRFALRSNLQLKRNKYFNLSKSDI